MGFLHIGKNVMVSRPPHHRRIRSGHHLPVPRPGGFWTRRKKDGVVLLVCLRRFPKSFLVCDHPYHRQIVYISQLNTQTLVTSARKTNQPLPSPAGKQKGKERSPNEANWKK